MEKSADSWFGTTGKIHFSSEISILLLIIDKEWTLLIGMHATTKGIV